MVNFKDITTAIDTERMNESIPESMRGYEFIKMDDIAGIPIKVLDFALYESKDINKYSVGNTTGVHIVLANAGKTYRTSTHGKRIVTAFEYLNSNGGIPTEGIETAFVKVTTNNGQSMWDFKY